MLGALPLALACMAQVLPEEIAGFVDPAFPQFDAVKHHDRDSLARGPVLVHPCSFAACLNDHDLAGRGLTRAEAHARCGEEVGGGLRQGRANGPRGPGKLAAAVSAGASCFGQLKTCP